MLTEAKQETEMCKAGHGGWDGGLGSVGRPEVKTII